MPESKTKKLLTRGKRWFESGASLLLTVVAVSSLLAGLAVFGWQVNHWARTGGWQPVTVMDALSPIGVSVRAPTPWGWMGLRRIVEWMPVSTTGIVGGTFLLIFATALRDKSRRAT